MRGVFLLSYENFIVLSDVLIELFLMLFRQILLQQKWETWNLWDGRGL